MENRNGKISSSFLIIQLHNDFMIRFFPIHRKCKNRGLKGLSHENEGGYCSANVYDDISGNRVALPNQIFHPDRMFV